MRTTDSNTILQWKLARDGTGGGQRTAAEQFRGIYDGHILDTDATNPTLLKPGTCRVVIPSYDGNTAIGPCAYPGTTAPPNNTPVTVGFIAPVANSDTSAITVRVLAFIGWGGGGSGTTDPSISPFLLMGA